MPNNLSFKGHEQIWRKTSSATDSKVLNQISKTTSDQIKNNRGVELVFKPGTIEHDTFSPSSSTRVKINSKMYEPKDRTIELIQNYNNGVAKLSLHEDWLDKDIAGIFDKAYKNLHNLFCNKN